MFYPIKNRLLKTENTNRNYVASPNQGQERNPNKNTTSKTQTETMLFLMNIESIFAVTGINTTDLVVQIPYRPNFFQPYFNY